MRYLTAFLFETLIVTDKVVGLTHSAEEAFVTLQGSDIRYTYGGQDPTQLEGHILHSGHSLRLHGDNQVKSFKAISTSDKPAILSVSYERP